MFKQLRGIAKSKIFGIIIIGGLVMAFSLWGVGDIFRGVISTSVAQVGDTEITNIQFSREVRGRMQDMGQQMNTNFTMEQARQFGIGQIVIDELVSRAAVHEVAQNLGLTAPNDMVRNTIQAQPAFQNLNGQQIVQALNSSGYTEQEYVESVRSDITRMQLLQSIGTGVIPPTGLVNLLHSFINETRIINYVILNPENIDEIPSVTEEQIVEFHAARPDLFNAPEYRSIEYVVIGPTQVAAQVETTEEELLQEYENPIIPLGVPETREIQQLIFDDQEAALAARMRIEEGITFLTIAEERGLNADDISRGTLTLDQLDGAAAEAAFSLELGSVTEPVEGIFGWILLHVTNITPGTELTFEEARDQIRESLVTQRAANLIADLANAYSDSTAGGAILPVAATRIGIESIALEAIDNAGLLPDGTLAPIPSDPTFLEQVFLTVAGEETFLYEGQDQLYYAIRVNSVTPAALHPLETVRPEVERAWEDDARANARQRRAMELLEEAQTNGLDSVAQSLSRTLMVSMPLRRDSFSETIGPQLLQQIFSISQGSTTSGLAANGEDYIIVRIEDVSHPVPDITSDEYNQLVESMAAQMGQDVIDTFVNAAREDVGVTTYPDAMDIAMGLGFFY